MKSNTPMDEFGSIYEKYSRLLYRIAFTYLKNQDDVADLLQDVFIKRLYKAPKFESDEHEKRWMIRITVNLAKDQLKSFWRKNVMVNAEETLLQSECQGWEFNDVEKEIYTLVMELPEKQKIVTYLYYFEGYTCREIAGILHCKESTIKMRLKKAREILKIEMKE